MKKTKTKETFFLNEYLHHIKIHIKSIIYKFNDWLIKLDLIKIDKKFQKKKIKNFIFKKVKNKILKNVKVWHHTKKKID